MTVRDPRPPLPARLLLRLRPLGTRRAEVEADLQEAFLIRIARDGALRAALRYYLDVLSVWRWNPSGARLLRDAVQDLTHGLRIFRRSPGAVAVTTIGLAIAIAVSTSIFSVLNAIAFRPVGVADPDSAVRVYRPWKGGVSSAWSFGEYLSLRERSRQTVIETSLAGRARFSTAPADDNAQSVSTTFVGGGYMGTFGARPELGRILLPSDDLPGAAAVVVVNHGFWARRLNADPAIVGREIWLNGIPVMVAGVVSPSFTGVAQVPPAFWAPFSSYPVLTGGNPLTGASTVSVDIVGRKPATMGLAQSEAELGAVAAAIGSESQDPYRPTGVRLVTARASLTNAASARALALIVTVILVVVGLVVLLACLNVANLQLASAIARQREIGVRLALGATRARLVRQLVTESLALGLAAGAIGLIATRWLVPTLAALVQMPTTIDVAPDFRVYLFLAIVSVAAGVGSGMAPARHGTRGDLMTPLKGDGPRVGPSGRPNAMRATLIGVQAAASLILLVSAALLTRAAVRATHVDLGFDAGHLVAISPGLGRGYDEARTRTYLDVAVDRIQSMSGVQAVSLADTPPYGTSFGVFTLTRDGKRYNTYLTRTGAGYFATLGLRVVKGRTYTAAEVAANAPVAVISETVAREFWPGADPIGATFEDFRKSRLTVIGVVSDTITARLRQLRTAALYWPLTMPQAAQIVVRTSDPPEAVAPALRAALQPLDQSARLDITLVRDGLERELDQPRIIASMAGALAALALALAVVGIYGVTAFVTGQRTREIGVRIAVGATARDVTSLLVADSLRPVTVGLFAGLLVSLAAGRLFADVLYGVKAHDPLAFTGAAAVLLVSAAASVYIPTRRAARVDPVVVLRQS